MRLTVHPDVYAMILDGVRISISSKVPILGSLDVVADGTVPIDKGLVFDLRGKLTGVVSFVEHEPVPNVLDVVAS